jgi:hypothetical protein
MHGRGEANFLYSFRGTLKKPWKVYFLPSRVDSQENSMPRFFIENPTRRCERSG